MNEDGPQFALSCKDSGAPAPVLVGVQAQGRLDAVLFELTLRQTYRIEPGKRLAGRVGAFL